MVIVTFNFWLLGTLRGLNSVERGRGWYLMVKKQIFIIYLDEEMEQNSQSSLSIQFLYLMPFNKNWVKEISKTKNLLKRQLGCLDPRALLFL